MHNRVSSLLNEHKTKKRSQHSNSFSKKQKNLIDQSSQLFAPQHFITDFLTYPVSTEGNRGSRFLPKQSKHLPQYEKDKKKRKAQEKSASLKSKNKKSMSKQKKSLEKHDKSINNKTIKRKKQSMQSKKQRLKGNNPFSKYNSSKKLSPDHMSNTLKITRANSKQTKPHNTGQNFQQILEEYGEFLTVSEISEIKEYKNIYFLGKIKSRKNKKLFSSNKKTPKSAREKIHHRSSQKKQKIEIPNMLTQRKQKDHEVVIENPNADDQFYKYEIGDHIAYRYQIIESISNGAFGQVIKVYDHKTKEFQALKIIRKSQQLIQQTLVQISILTHIRENDKKDLSGIVKVKDFTIFRQHICIAFELLDGNLYEFIASNNHCGLTQNAIRFFAVQLLNSLTFLRQEKIIHCDIKPENIVMKKWGKSGIKLVDFGTSCFEGKQIYEYLQSRFYRSPQIILHQPYSFPMDMWSLGCILAELKLGEPLYPASNDIEHLLFISKSIGVPKQKDGQYSTQFLKTQEMKEVIEKYYLQQYELIKDKEETLKDHPFFSKCKYLKTSMKTLKERLVNGTKGSRFYEFIAKILVWQPEKRLKPEEALQDPWIVEGISKQIKEVYTFFTSRDKSKQSKNKNSRSKSKSKSSNNKQKKEPKAPNKSPSSKVKVIKNNTKPTFSSKNRQKSMELPSRKSTFLNNKQKRCIL